MSASDGASGGFTKNKVSRGGAEEEQRRSAGDLPEYQTQSKLLLLLRLWTPSST